MSAHKTSINNLDREYNKYLDLQYFRLLVFTIMFRVIFRPNICIYFSYILVVNFADDYQIFNAKNNHKTSQNTNKTQQQQLDLYHVRKCPRIL